MGKIAGFIDKIKDVTIADNTEWLKEPYNLVTKKEEYETPHDYLPKKLADKIASAQSLQADLYWTRMKHTNDTKIAIFCLEFSTVLKWISWLIVYGILFILGLLTAGFFWPRSLRRHILSIGMARVEKSA